MYRVDECFGVSRIGGKLKIRYNKSMEKFKIKTMSFWRRTGILVAGFGFGGVLWGLEVYRGTVGSDEVFTNPFSYILGAVALGVFGGLALAYISQINGSFSMSRLFLYLVSPRSNLG